jgi:hypothetical protein
VKFQYYFVTDGMESVYLFRVLEHSEHLAAHSTGRHLLTHALALGIIIAQKAWLELALHTRGAINNGVSELEIRETVLHATVYCGTPAGVEAMMVTERTINEMLEKGEYKRPEPKTSN